MFLIIGLGNPGPEYRYHRHNVGFMVVDAIVQKYGLSGPKKKFNAEIFDGTINGHKVLAVKPMTFMNLSGDAVRAVMDFYKIELPNIIVIHDELDLDPGQLKIKVGGGNAGHNGLRSIDAHMGVNYKRLRFGIGHPGNKDLVSPFVLHDFHRDEQNMADDLCQKIAENFALLLANKDNEFLKGVTG